MMIFIVKIRLLQDDGHGTWLLCKVRKNSWHLQKKFFFDKVLPSPSLCSPFVLPSLVLRLSFAYPSLFLRYHSGESASYKRSSEQEANTHPRSSSFSVNNVRMQFYLEYLENTGNFEKNGDEKMFPKWFANNFWAGREEGVVFLLPGCLLPRLLIFYNYHVLSIISNVLLALYPSPGAPPKMVSTAVVQNFFFRNIIYLNKIRIFAYPH